jgi:SNF2 family DNA or RNA helicase
MIKFSEYYWPIAKPEAKVLELQKETVKFQLKHKRAFILNDMGTGKTMCSLWTMDLLFLNQKIKKVLITSPLSTIQSVWGNEIFLNFPQYTYAIAHGSKEKRIEAINSDVHFVIINHHGLSICQNEIIKAKFDVFIVDELAVFKNPKTEMTQAAIKIASKIKSVYGLTAEPTPENPTEAYSQAKIVNPWNPLLPQSFYAFKNSVMRKIAPFVEVPLPEAKQKVYGILQPAVRYTRDMMTDLPSCQTIDIEIPMTESQTILYKRMKEQLLIEFSEGLITAANSAVKMLKLIQIAGGWVKNDDGQVLRIDSKPRLEEMLKIYKDTHNGKLVVLTTFRGAVTGLNDYFNSKGISSQCIYGDVSAKMRTEHINNFQNGDLNVLVIQPMSAAHGITLTAASNIIWHTPIPSRTYYGQSNGRISRLGQKHKQLIIRFHGCKEEQRILKLLDGKENMSKSVLSMFEHL